MNARTTFPQFSLEMVGREETVLGIMSRIELTTWSAAEVALAELEVLCEEREERGQGGVGDLRLCLRLRLCHNF